MRIYTTNMLSINNKIMLKEDLLIRVWKVHRKQYGNHFLYQFRLFPVFLHGMRHNCCFVISKWPWSWTKCIYYWCI